MKSVMPIIDSVNLNCPKCHQSADILFSKAQERNHVNCPFCGAFITLDMIQKDRLIQVNSTKLVQCKICRTPLIGHYKYQSVYEVITCPQCIQDAYKDGYKEARKLLRRYERTDIDIETVCINKKKLIAIHSALYEKLGDTDPYFDEDMTDEDIRNEDPVFWACKELGAYL